MARRVEGGAPHLLDLYQGWPDVLRVGHIICKICIRDAQTQCRWGTLFVRPVSGMPRHNVGGAYYRPPHERV